MVESAYEYEHGVLYCGNVNSVLDELPEESVDCIVTSPPYFGLRDYGTASWVGGDENCSHEFGRHMRGGTLDGKESNFQNNNMGSYGDEAVKNGESCPKCGAIRKDLQVGLEQTPQEYIERLIGVFRSLRRVLKEDGVAWLNLGDTYWGGKGRSGAGSKKTHKERTSKTLQGEHTYLGKSKGFRPQDRPSDIFKPKDLMLIPHRVAIALQEDGWWVRQDIVWHKPNPMPESVRDRCTKAHEYVFMLTKSKKYFYDSEAIKEPLANTKSKNMESGDTENIPKKNKRSVWSVPPKSFKGAHFATFPPKLIEPCILAGCREGGVVLDPFVGSGTTCVVAQEHGRHFIGIDLNKEYLALANDRITNS